MQNSLRFLANKVDESRGERGKESVLVSGGRYDGLLKNLGSKKDTSAVGAAIDMSLL